MYEIYFLQIKHNSQKYLVWLRKNKRKVVGLIERITLFIYVIISILQPGNFTRVYAAYGRIHILSFIILEVIMDKKRPHTDIKIIG